MGQHTEGDSSVCWVELCLGAGSDVKSVPWCMRVSDVLGRGPIPWGFAGGDPGETEVFETVLIPALKILAKVRVVRF